MEVSKRLVSKDGSIKYLFSLPGNNSIESLFMNDNKSELTYPTTACISSQVGCKLGCVFCATGKSGYIRNLEVDEIYKQVMIINSESIAQRKKQLDAVVFAGMGEPLLNYDNVSRAIKKIHSELGINNFEITTVGIVPNIYKLMNDFASEKLNIRLNISLHGSTNELRKRLIPFSTSYGLDEVIKAAIDYSNKFKSKVRMRYMLLKGINDTDMDIENLCELLHSKPLKLVVSQYNDNNIPGLAVPEIEGVMEFCQKLNNRIDYSLFNNFGSDIYGGCGQLSSIYSISGS